MNLRAHRTGEPGASSGLGALGGLGGGLQKQVAAVMHATWHIIQVGTTCMFAMSVTPVRHSSRVCTTLLEEHHEVQYILF